MPSSCTRATSQSTRARKFSRWSPATQKVVDLHGAIEIALAQPVGNHRPAEGARDQVGAAAQRGHQLGFQIGGIPAFGAQAQAMRARHAGFVTVVAGEGELAGLRVDAVQHDARAIDLGVRGVQLHGVGEAGDGDGGIGEREAAAPGGFGRRRDGSAGRRSTGRRRSAPGRGRRRAPPARAGIAPSWRRWRWRDRASGNRARSRLRCALRRFRRRAPAREKAGVPVSENDVRLLEAHGGRIGNRRARCRGRPARPAGFPAPHSRWRHPWFR